METKSLLIEKFKNIYGNADGVGCFFAPGRVNLIGEHTDYNGGYVLPCALTIGTYVAIRKRKDKSIKFVSLNQDSSIYKLSIDNVELVNNKWVNYPLGIVWTLNKRGVSFDCGFEMLVYGNIPEGAGLSSSASLEIVTCFALNTLYNLKLSNQDIALISQFAENNFIGMKCGIMDQFASAMGKKNHAIFLDTESLSFEYVPINLDGMSLIITNTNKKHKLTDSEYNKRRDECNEALKALQLRHNIKNLCDFSIEEFEMNKNEISSEVARKRAKHVIYENTRTKKAVELLKNNDYINFGKLMNESHISLRDDFEVTGMELDTLVEEALKVPGVIGSRMTGAGFGGSTISIVKNEDIQNFKYHVGSSYKEKIGYDCTFYIVSVGDGPTIIQ